MEEKILTVDYGTFNLRRSGYAYNLETPPDIDRGLGKVTVRAKVVELPEHYRIDSEFPWDPADKDSFVLADPIHLVAFRDTVLQRTHPWIFAIGQPRQHSKGLLVGCLSSRQPLGHDTYLPSWTVGPVDPGFKFDESKGFPPGVGFLVIARQS